MSEEKKGSSATNVQVTKDADTWEVLVKAEIPAEALAHYRTGALKEIQRDASLDGFRKGHAPESEIIRIYGETAILRHAAEHAIQHELPEILAKENLPIIETPRVTTEAPVIGKPLVFTARAALAPKIELPDYKAIAKKNPAPKEEVTVSDTEHEHAMTHLKRERARIEKVEAGKPPAEAAEESRKMEEKDLPALDDMEARLKDDLVRAGTTIEAYLAQVKKTRDDLRKEWKDAADKRARIRLILTEIGRKENVEPDEEALKNEVEQAKKQYPQADVQILRTHIAHAMRNEAVLKFLENSGV